MAEREGIFVTYRPLDPASGALGLYVRDERGPIIILDQSLPSSPRLERCVLAEELGHHFTAPTTSVFVVHTSATLRTAYRRDEARALRWACDYLMPVNDFLRAIREGVTAVEDLADLFYVTPWMVQVRFRFLPHYSCRRQRLCRRWTCLGCPEVA